MPRYRAFCGERQLGDYGTLKEAINALAGCTSTLRVERCETVLKLEPHEYEELALAAPGKKEAVAEEHTPETGGSQSRHPVAEAAVVFDQMFKRFAEILDRELEEKPLVFHEIVGRGLEHTLRVAERIYQEPARDDYDVLKLLENLAKRYTLVVFFTGDRRLAAQARTLKNVHVVYLPPGEVAGKEMAIKLMKKEILKALSGKVGRKAAGG